jgi:hypothetical protein
MRQEVEVARMSSNGELSPRQWTLAKAFLGLDRLVPYNQRILGQRLMGRPE